MSASVVELVAAQAGARDELLDRREAAGGVASSHASIRASRCCRNRSARRSRFDHRLVVAAAFGARSAAGAAARSADLWLERRRAAIDRDRLPDLFAQPVHVAQPEPNRAVVLDRRSPSPRLLHVDRMEADAAALRVLDERRRVIEPHRLVVEERRVERRRVMHLEIRARVGQQREARRVRFGKSVQRERRDRRDDPLRGLAGDALPRHALAQLHFDLLHPLLGSLEAHRAPQFLGLAAGESGGHHRHPQQLLLEQRHAERAREHRLERRMRGTRPARVRRADSDTDAPSGRRSVRAG